MPIYLIYRELNLFIDYVEYVSNSFEMKGLSLNFAPLKFLT